MFLILNSLVARDVQTTIQRILLSDRDKVVPTAKHNSYYYY